MEKNTRQKVMEMAYASSLGIAMAISVFGCLLIGAYLDRKFQTTANVFTVLFLVIGILAGFWNFYVFIKQLLDKEKRETSVAKKSKEALDNEKRKRSHTEKN